MADPSPPLDLSALARETRCDGRYPVPQTSPPRDEPFDVTYRCALPLGHVGPHGDGEVSWQSAALRVGEELSSVGPNGYYEMTPEQWLAWALAEVARLRGELEQAHRTVRSLAAMMGWDNVPPRETLERNLSAIKSRAEQAERDLAQARQEREHIKSALTDDSLSDGVKVKAAMTFLGGLDKVTEADIAWAQDVIRRLLEGAGEGKP